VVNSGHDWQFRIHVLHVSQAHTGGRKSDPLLGVHLQLRKDQARVLFAGLLGFALA
jgi:hypothetical protein